MKLIVGLGNPGKEYASSRHNAGFVFLDELLQNSEINFDGGDPSFRLEKKFSAEVLEAKIGSEKLILAKPQTYMNLSGETVGKILSYYKIDISDLIVISDDLDLPVGILRVRHDGASGGQKGLQNIIDTLSDDAFTRFRIGISESEENIPIPEVNNYVLGKIGKRAMPVLKETIAKGINYLVEHIKGNEEIPAHTISVK